MGRIVGRKRATLKGKQQQQQDSTDAESEPTDTVHRRNVHLFAQPVILAFHVIRFVAFQLWLVLSFMYRVGSNVLTTRQHTSDTARTAGARKCHRNYNSPSLPHPSRNSLLPFPVISNFITGPPNGTVLFCTLSSVGVVCRRL